MQHRFGCIDADAIQAIAAGLHVHAVEVEDMVSFYALFSRQPEGRFHIRLSRTPISMVKGAMAVAAAFEAALGVAVGETSADRALTLGWTSDIGVVDQEPSALVNGTVLTLRAPGNAPNIVATLRRGSSHPKAVVVSSLVQSGTLLSSRRAGRLLMDRVCPTREVVTIDYFLPGCPPSGDAIWEGLRALLTGREPQLPYQLCKYE